MGTRKLKMHPRNVFRELVDYTDMAIKYSNFRKVCKLRLNGKVQIDLKEKGALEALSRTLLEEYFQLKVEFAPGSLIPTVPLRLNYLLWIEDILKGVPTEAVRGIDIGCGSSCIYSILAARKNSWHMVGLESQPSNLQYAAANVHRNNLQHLVEIYEQQDKKQIFGGYFSMTTADDTNDQPQFHFCLCNPPFFDSALAQPLSGNTRNPGRRSKPRNCHTGQLEELTCDGGEVGFVQRIVEESLLYRNRIRVFTSMLGHKSSVTRICDFLRLKDISNFATTEFCQGKTTRWGIAWTFHEQLVLKNIKCAS